MRHYILRRLMLMPITLIGITFIVFCLTRMVPGGPVERMLQEQAISALAGDKALGGAGTANPVDEENIERLEELFNLQEPVWKAYLQWLGVLPQEVDVSKAEFGEDGSAYLTVTPHNQRRAAVIEVQRDGDVPKFLSEPWFAEEGWNIRLESPRDRALRWAKRNKVTDAAAIREHETCSHCRHWRAIAYRDRHEGLLQGRLGLSYKYNEPVGHMMLSRLPVSLYFGILGALITYMVSIPLGVFKALYTRAFLTA